MLIVLGGLPGTGKTTIGKALAAKRSAVYLRIDEIENALRGWVPAGKKAGPEGYAVGQAISLSNLKLGNWVIADSVNPIAESRHGWREIARQAGSLILEVELICSDAQEHRRRVEARTPDIDGSTLPNWASVQTHEYSARSDPRLVVDTATHSVDEALFEIEASVNAMPAEGSRHYC